MNRFSARFERDWAFYTALPLRFHGGIIPLTALDPAGADAKEAFWRLDSTGVTPPCREPEALRAARQAKASLNWHIKVWREGIAEGTFTSAEIIADLETHTVVPPWVREALDPEHTT